VRVVAIG
jgi:hypothetical protein